MSKPSVLLLVCKHLGKINRVDERWHSGGDYSSWIWSLNLSGVCLNYYFRLWLLERLVRVQHLYTWSMKPHTLIHTTNDGNSTWCYLPVVRGRMPGPKPWATVLPRGPTCSPQRLTRTQSNTLLHWSSPAGLLNLSWDNLPWGNEELEGRKEVSWRFTGFNSCYCHPGTATGPWLYQ